MFERLTLIFIAVLLAGCASPSALTAVPVVIEQATPSPVPVIDSTPTPESSPVAPTLEPSPIPSSTPTPSETPTPLPTLEPTYLAFLTPTPSPTPGPNAADIQIYVPGPMSKVSSPIELRAFLSPNASGNTWIDVYGEDGRLLVRESLRSAFAQGSYISLDRDIAFEIRAAAELGRLQISTTDDDGRLKAVSSVHVMLMSEGASLITPPGNTEEAVILEKPNVRGQARDGAVEVAGRMMPFNSAPVIAELVNDKGQAISQRVLPLFPADGQYHDFTVSIPFKVAKYTPVLLVIRQIDDRIPGLFYLYSQELFLNP